MKISLTVTPEDFVAFNIYHLRNAPASRSTRCMIYFGIPLTMLILFLLFTLLTGIKLFLIGGLVCVSYYLLRSKQNLLRLIRKQVAKTFAGKPDNSILGPRDLELTGDGITESNEMESHFIHWNAISQVIETPTHCFIYNSPISAIIIPKQCNNASGDINTFIAETSRRLAQHRNKANTPAE